MKENAKNKKAEKVSAVQDKKVLGWKKLEFGRNDNLVTTRLSDPEIDLTRLDGIAEKYRKRYADLVAQGYFADLDEEFEEASEELGDRLHVAVALDVSVTDEFQVEERMVLKRHLKEFGYEMVQNFMPDEVFFRTYIVGNSVKHGTNAACPVCWGEWQYKLSEHECPHCNAEMGKEVRFLIDEDRCPDCDTKGILENGMCCPACCENLEPEMIAWPGN